ncbi:hypothetical protein ACHAWC_007067 [Mediolabrus comicus]
MTTSQQRPANRRNNHEEMMDHRSDENSCRKSPPLEATSPKGGPFSSGSPSRFRGAAGSSSRTRSRTPSPPQSSPASRQSLLRINSSKAPRSISPGGTAASSAPAVTRRGVRFVNQLVTSVWTRPRTPPGQRAKLFYSRADEIRFREEAAYACDDDDDWLDQLEEDSLPDESSYTPQTQREQRTKYSISKAVVVFGSTTRTYGIGGGCALEAALENEKASAFSFDDSAFWNGEITWS